ncbi:MAG: MATE family efflux transporter [Thermogutta sp.]|nr:MATE family efflux transporter [Thermogutta sp.]HPZ83263.1 MATE family efflux transporter [Thermogutta sp.]
MLKRLRRWWLRPCGARTVLTVAMPLVISFASWTVMNFTDRMFLVWYDIGAVAAVLPAGMVQWTLAAFAMGLVSYVTTFVAQYQGAKRYHRVGPVLGQAYWTALLFIPPLMATIPFAYEMFSWIGHPPELAELEARYYQVAMLAVGAMLFSSVQAGFFTGRGDTRTVMIVDTGAALLNLVLDYLWIFGHLGFPEGGVEGAAWASTVAQWAKVVWYGVLMSGSRYDEYCLRDAWRFEGPLFRRLWRFGGPNGLQWLLEGAGFTGFLLLVGRLGEMATAATNLAINVNSVAFVPAIGLSIAVTTLVGQELGANRPRRAAVATWTAFHLAVIYTAVLAIIYVAAPDVFLVAYGAGHDPAEFAPLRELVIVLLRFVAIYCIFDAMNLVFSGALRGAGDTRFILLVGLVMSPIPTVLIWWGITSWSAGITFSWVVITLWTCALGVIYLVRFLQGHWRTIRVIEQTVIDEAESISELANLPVKAPAGILSEAD